MKKLALFLVTLFLLSSCDGLSDIFQSKITIKGKLSTSKNINGSHMKSSGSLTLADATKVLAYYGNKYTMATIKNGSFSIQVPEGSATCLVFLDADNQFIGNLFAGGLNVLPLVGLGDVSSIDLSNLTLDGTRVIPSNDPIGSTIQISEQEIAFMQSVSAYYQTLSKNLDMDNDSSPDVVDGDHIRVNSMVKMNVGTFGTDTKEPVLFDPTHYVMSYSMRIAGAKSMYDKEYTVSLTNTTDNFSIPLNWDPLAADPKLLTSPDQTEFILVFQRNQESQAFGNLPFPDGIYNFKLREGREYNFNFSNINMQNHLMIIKPTLHTDSEGYITTVTFEFVFPDRTTANPHNLIQGYIQTYIEGNPERLYWGHNLYGTFNAGDNYDYYNEKISPKVKLSDVESCNLNYIDILGNEYGFNWQKN